MVEKAYISERGLEFIRQHEGCKLEAYQDSVGVWTIGYGHTIGVKQGDTCTQEQADAWLAEDAAQIGAKCINWLVKVPLTQEEFDALCSFSFNLGCSALRNSTLLKKLNDRDYAGAAEEFSKWDHAGGKQIAGLTKRRSDERELFETTV